MPRIRKLLKRHRVNGKDYDKLFFETEPPPLTGAMCEICQIRTHVAPAHLLFGDTLEMLSQDDILGIIAELATKQVHATNVGCIFFNTDSDCDGLGRSE
jgi:hypothetical protein